MPVLNNKRFLFLLLCTIMPLHSMFTSKTFNRLKQIEAKRSNIQTNQKKYVTVPQQPITKENAPASSSSWLSNLLPKTPSLISNWWYGPPLEEKLSNVSTQISTTIQTAKTNWENTIKLKKIIKTLQKDNYVSYTSEQNIEFFLQDSEDNPNNKNLLNETLKYLGGSEIMWLLCKNYPLIRTKIVTILREENLNQFLPTLPPRHAHSWLKFIIKTFVEYPDYTDANELAIVNIIKAQLLDLLNHQPLYISAIESTQLLKILPNEAELFIATINNWQQKIDFNLKNGVFSEWINSFQINQVTYTHKISSLLAEKIMAENNEKNKEKLYAFITKHPYFNQIINEIRYETPYDTLTNIVQILEKKISSDNITNSQQYIKKILNLASSASNHSLAINLLNKIIPTIQEKLTNDLKTLTTIQQDSLFSIIQDVLYFTSQYYPSLKNDLKNLIKQQATKLLVSSTGLKLLIKVLSPSELIDRTLGTNNEYTETPSYKHLKKYAAEIISVFPIIFANYKSINMVTNILKKEKELNDLGYETFYHARRWQYGLLSDIYNMLFEYLSGEKLNDFIFTHIDDPVLGEKINPLFFKSERAKQALLLEKGNTPNDSIGIAGYQNILFLNKFLFGNTNRLGESSMYYMLSNVNITNKEFSISELFSMFNESVIYNTYEQQLKELEQEYTQLSNHGELLLIAVPKNKIKNYVYYTVYGGEGDDGQRKSFNIPEIGNTFDIEKILEYQNKNPQDAGIYNLINTKTAGLDPKSGIKFFAFNLVDPDVIKTFKEKESHLFSEIKKAIKKEHDKKEANKLSRE